MDGYDQIVALFETSDPIPEENILKWMQSDDLKILGALYELTNQAWSRIQPKLPTSTTCRFILHYYRRCLLENPTSRDFLLNRHEAALEMANWMKYLATNSGTGEILTETENTLKELYMQGDKDLKDCILKEILEPIFEEKGLVDLFQEWRRNPQLKIAFDSASEAGQEQPG